MALVMNGLLVSLYVSSFIHHIFLYLSLSKGKVVKFSTWICWWYVHLCTHIIMLEITLIFTAWLKPVTGTNIIPWIFQWYTECCSSLCTPLSTFIYIDTLMCLQSLFLTLRLPSPTIKLPDRHFRTHEGSIQLHRKNSQYFHGFP